MKILKEIIIKSLIGALAVIFALSLYLNYSYYVKSRQEEGLPILPLSSQATNRNLGVAGKVISIDPNKKLVRIKNDKHEMTIKIDFKTEFFRNLMDPIKPRFERAVFEDLKTDINIGISMSSGQLDSIAKRIDIPINNTLSGNIKEIRANEILVLTDEKTLLIKINEKTVYYRNLFYVADPENKPPDKTVPDIIPISDLKVDDQIVVFFTDGNNIIDQIALSILVIEKK